MSMAPTVLTVWTVELPSNRRGWDRERVIIMRAHGFHTGNETLLPQENLSILISLTTEPGEDTYPLCCSPVALPELEAVPW